MSHLYGPADEELSIKTIRRAIDLGVKLIDTADAYGLGHNERLVGRAIAGRRDEVVLGTKFGLVGVAAGAEPGDIESMVWDASPTNVKSSIDASLERLGVDHVDLYYLHFYDGSTPIEDTVAAMAELVDVGKVRHLGLCGVDAEILRRAQAVHPISALQSDYSLLSRGLERDVLPVAKSLGIGVVPFSPLARGLLSGNIHTEADLAEGDFRLLDPRFHGDTLAALVARMESIRSIGAAAGGTLPQVALAWLLAQYEGVVPIPGTTNPANLESNIGCLDVELSAWDLQALDVATS
jgi:aryl-alcohol dehydrogenase-like predicted oxidoreductase